MAHTYRIIPIDYEPASKLLSIVVDDPANFRPPTT